MCVPKALSLGGIGLATALGGPAGLAGGLLGRAILGGKKKPAAPDPNLDQGAYTSALAQGVGAKKAMRTALLVGARNQMAAAGKAY
jgi:hypothetical protein